VKATDIGKLLSTSFMLTTVWLLPRMGTVVDSQCTSLNKSFGASGMGTVIRTFIGMYAIMSLEIRLAVKALIRHSQPLLGLRAAVRSGTASLPLGNPPRYTRTADLIACR
jgi:hypothetical protein